MNLTRNSWCTTIFFTSLASIVAIICLDYKFEVLPLHGVLLLGYTATVIIISIWATFVSLQKFLQNSKPLKNNSVLKLFYNRFNLLQSDQTDDRRKPIDERIDDFTGDVEKRFVLRWYHHISTDPSFPFESKALLDEVIRRFLQVVISVDGKKLLHGALVVLLKHLKEFRKTARRVERNGGTIEEQYRYAHIGSKSDKAMEHFIHQLTANVFRQMITWELWNSLPCRALVAILAKKLSTFLLIYISSPGLINYKLANSCAKGELQAKLALYGYISLSDVDHSGALQRAKKIAKIEPTTQSNTPKLSPKKPKAKRRPFEEPLMKSVPVKIPDQKKSELDPFRPKASEPVKIHESKSACNKTWRNSSDLECISLGQDLLALQDTSDPDSQIQDLIGKKLWKDNADSLEIEGNPIWEMPEGPFGEDEPDAVSPGNLQNYIRSAQLIAKPIGNVTASTLHNMKEFQQSTVNNVVKPVSHATSTAMHRIGDLQDEAAGMVEGILDFGMAGIRKGLRLTGLQDNFTEIAHKAKHEFHKPATAKLVKTPRIASEDKIEIIGSEETVWINPLTKESPNFDGDILLERTPESLPKSFLEDKKHNIPLIDTEYVPTGDSPDPEYEEPADLATTIAKLKSLLQQKSSESTFTTPSLSPMPQEELIKLSPLEANTERDGTMPSIYKFCARTATGVFQNTINTIKTALPGNTQGDGLIYSNINSWTFLANDSSNNDFHSRMVKLLSERRAFCTVDTAYEAIDSLEIINPNEELADLSAHLDDESDDFDLQIPITKTLFDIICELVNETALIQEPVIKSILLLIGTTGEEEIERLATGMLRNVNRLVGKLPDGVNADVMAMKLEKMTEIITDRCPEGIKRLLGRETITAAMKFLIGSLQSQKINQDIVLQIFELFSAEFIYASSQMSPTYSA